MKTSKNSKIISAALSILIGSVSLSAKDQRYSVDQSMSSKGGSKSEALANAITCLPYGATIKKVNYNGWTSTKAGKVTYSNYRCQVIYSTK